MKYWFNKIKFIFGAFRYAYLDLNLRNTLPQLKKEKPMAMDFKAVSSDILSTAKKFKRGRNE